jgi:3-phytase
MLKSIVILSSTLILSACSLKASKEPDEIIEVDPMLSAQNIAYGSVAESFLTPLTPLHNIDSPASWLSPDGSIWLIATAKATDKLVVYDGETGLLRKAIGGKGAKLGQFSRPNGIFVIDNLVFVVERDNRRVQVLSLPELRPLGAFGSSQLVSPYGLWVDKKQQGYDVLVSDAYMNGDTVPPLSQLDRRFKRYHLNLMNGFQAEHVADFGNTDLDGAIQTGAMLIETSSCYPRKIRCPAHT